MASRFVLTAQVQLQAPTNARQVVNQIQQQLRGVNMQVNLQGGQQAARQVNNLSNATQQATTAANRMGKAFGASIRRFGAFTIATRAVSLFTNSLANATKEAIDFEREMIKISQVTGKTMAQLKGLENTITDLSTSLGVSSKSILSVGRILSQAGIQAQDLEVALRTLAKTELAPTFDDITKTAEGAVAILAQFGEGVGALERQLGAINAVAGQFAVESGDLISVVRRTGGVFKAAGGELEELLALFTSVRATTRESAESIATGLRTIFTRIQRPETIDFLKQFGVELTDLNGKFVGPYEAIRQLSSALAGLGEGDIRFVQIAEELGGFRQIGKVIPLLQQFETAERARQAALEGGDSLNKDAAKAQAALAVQIAKVKEEFLALIRSLTQTTSFQVMVKTSLELASALIKVAEALKPVVPLLAAFGAIKFARGAAGFARGIGAGLRGGSPTGFATGGMVPGVGNRDTVPAMLTPGEFVIRKSSVKKLGADTLAQMNQNKRFRGTPGVRGELVNLGKTKQLSTAAGTQAVDPKNANRVLTVLNKEFLQEADLDTYGAAFLRPFGSRTVFKGKTDKSRVQQKLINTPIAKQIGIVLGQAGFGPGSGSRSALKGQLSSIANNYANRNIFELSTGSLPKAEAEKLEDIVLGGVEATIRKGAGKLSSVLGMSTAPEVAKALKSANIDQVSGNIFEAILSFAGVPYSAKDNDAANAPFDFAAGLGSSLAKRFGLSKVANRPTEAKSYFTNDNVASLSKKVENYNIDEAVKDFQTAWLDTQFQLKGTLKGLQQGTLGNMGFGKNLAESRARIGMLSQRKPRQFAKGGIAASDTIPAMLTPGEFVFNANAAKSIGYSNLNRMNKHGVKGFNKGGAVGVQYFAGGTTGTGASSAANVNFKGINSASAAAERLSVTLQKMGVSWEQRLPLLLKFNEEMKKGGKVSEILFKTFKDTDISVRQLDKSVSTAGKSMIKHGFSPTGGGAGGSALAMINGAGASGGQLAPITAKSATQLDAPTQKLVASINQQVNATQKQTGIKGKLIALEQRYTNAVNDASQRIQDVFDRGLKGNFQSLQNSFKQLTGSMKGLATGGVGRVTSAFSGIANVGNKLVGNKLQEWVASKKAAFADKVEAYESERAAQADAREAGMSGGGGMMGGAGMGIMMAATSFAMLVPQVEGAVDGLGGMQNALGETVMTVTTFGFLLTMLGNGPLASIGKAAGGAAIAVYGFSKMVDAYTGVHEKAKKAIEEGNVEEAGAAAIKSGNASIATGIATAISTVITGAGAAIGFAIAGPAGAAVGAGIGAVVGAIAGVVAKIVLTMEALAPALEWFRDNVMTFFGADDTQMVKARAEAEAAAARYTKELAAASKSAADELNKVESGEKSIQEAFQSGNLTKGFSAQEKKNAADLKLIDEKRAQELRNQERTNSGGPAFIKYSGLGLINEAQRQVVKGTTGIDVGPLSKQIDDLGAAVGLWDSQTVKLSKIAEERDKAEKAANKAVLERLADPEFNKGFNKLAQNVANSAAAMGTGLSDMRPDEILGKVLEQMGPEAAAQVRAAFAADKTGKTAEEFATRVANMAKAAKENADFLKSLNFGLKDVTSGIATFNNSLDNIATASQTGFNSLAVATNTLSAVVAGAGATISAADLDSSLSTISSSFAAFGATQGQIDNMTATVKGFNQAQKNANGALDSLRSNLAGVDLSQKGNLTAVKDDFKAALLKTIPEDSPIRDKLANAFNNIGDLTQAEIEEFYNTGDASPILEKALGPLGEQIEKQIVGPSKQMAEANSKLIKATEERRKAELQLIEVQKKAIDVQIEAAKNLEFFGGEKFTPEKEFAARRNQANLSLQDAGVAGLTTGSAADIRRAAGDVFSRFSTQQGAQNAAIEGSGGTAGAFADRRGIDTDRRPELQKANEALLEITKRGIEQRKQELDLIQKKNKAEKDALDSLLGGNIEEFFEKSSAAAAGSALRSGNAAAASLFSASSLGKGLQGLQGTGLSDAENKRAAQLTFGAMGLGDRAAQIYTGTTAEEERIKAEGRELSQLQSDLGDQMSSMESMNVEAKQVIINTQDAKFREMQNTVAQNQAALGLHRGGAVYANRGIFVPRGTDTVPAMLTPGEFVVNRAAVQRGNNLQILRAMNGGMGVGATNSAGTPTMNRGGLFGRREAPSFQMPDLSPVFDKFSEAVDKLAGLNISVKLDTTNVNVNFNGTSFLSTLDEKIRSAVLQEVSNQTGKLGMNESGDIKSNSGSVLGS